ncbi:pimeloyl-ACP methyl ester carboxylesterase [Thermocatellispora tengchongensis]|uniref:Pimeloyl-ACP methyl ester carboxylesterase n=1 Tax=Thermocatellispora tengchongensis TaxID=1073253 RepID=A0A840P108_9ACTN|nr:alpha/beta hydrolase [Thermocatellispora tengchongensis]MBB5134934.1 pimeloyl-ACP methyl ester carboxylesterase [Thermocatellispora tengchongensis]
MPAQPPPTVLVHGIRVSRTMWHPVADRLRAAGHKVEALDLPGHGVRRGEPFTLAAAVAAVTEAIDAVGGRALVAGLSLGGFVSIATAAAHPERVAGLVAMGCTTRPRGAYAMLYRRMAALAGASPRRADRLSAFTFSRLLPGAPGRAVLEGGLSSEVMPAAAAAIMGYDPIAALAAYPGPVTLVNGSRDPFRADERDFLAACRDGRLIVIPGRGHIDLLADPATLTGILHEVATR